MEQRQRLESGALPAGTRVQRIPDGATGTITGSMGPFSHPAASSKFLYVVRWDDEPDVPVGVASIRLIVIPGEVQ